MDDVVPPEMSFRRIHSFADSYPLLHAQRIERGKNLINFGVSYLDDVFSGILQGDLILLGAQTGAGKTALATHIATQAAKSGKKVLYFALEADKNEIEQRLLYSEYARNYYANKYRVREEISFSKFYIGQLENSLVTDIAPTGLFPNLTFRYSDESYDLESFRRDLISYKDSCDMIVLDHLHYLDLGKEENSDYKNAVKQIRNLALEYNKPVLLVAQLRKKTIGQMNLCPLNDDFHGSSDITKIATKVITIAPASDHFSGSDSTMIETFIRAAKYRLDGSVWRYIAAVRFDLKHGEYAPGYKLGCEVRDKKEVVFKEIEPYLRPQWAKGAK